MSIERILYDKWFSRYEVLYYSRMKETLTGKAVDFAFLLKSQQPQVLMTYKFDQLDMTTKEID